MQSLSNHRYAVLGFGLAMLLLLWGWPRHGAMETYRNTSAPVSVMAPSLPPRAIRRRPSPAVQKPVAKSVVIFRELTGARLNRFGREYVASFAGRVTCKGEPCKADVEVFLDTVHNPDVSKTVTTAADGSYSLQLPVTEVVQEGLDWKVIAKVPAEGQSEASGHRILVEDKILSIDSTLNID